MCDFFGSGSLCAKHKEYFSDFNSIDTLKMNHVKKHYTKDDSLQNENKTNFFDSNTPRKYSKSDFKTKTNPEWRFQKFNFPSKTF